MLQASQVLALRGEAHPPLKPPSRIKVWSPKPKQPLRGVILSPQVEGFRIHYLREWNRTIPCVGKEQGCYGCGPTTSTRWQFYLGIYFVEAGRVGIVQITKEAKRTCPELCDPKLNLRGRMLFLERQGAAANSRVKADVREYTDGHTLPLAPDILPHLLKMWGIHQEAS